MVYFLSSCRSVCLFVVGHWAKIIMIHHYDRVLTDMLIVERTDARKGLEEVEIQKVCDYLLPLYNSVTDGIVNNFMKYLL